MVIFDFVEEQKVKDPVNEESLARLEESIEICLENVEVLVDSANGLSDSAKMHDSFAQEEIKTFGCVVGDHVEKGLKEAQEACGVFSALIPQLSELRDELSALIASATRSEDEAQDQLSEMEEWDEFIRQQDAQAQSDYEYEEYEREAKNEEREDAAKHIALLALSIVNPETKKFLQDAVAQLRSKSNKANIAPALRAHSSERSFEKDCGRRCSAISNISSSPSPSLSKRGAL